MFRIGTIILMVVGTALKAVFGSLWDRFFPPKTAAEQKADDLSASLEAEKRMAEADAKAPTDKQSLIDALKAGKVSLLLVSFLLLTNCAENVTYSCPVPRTWTPSQEDTIAANLATLPDNSPLIPVIVEWSRLRADSFACMGKGNG